MSNLIESISTLVQSFMDEEPVPLLHAGEVMSLWTLLTLYQEGHIVYRIALNTTTDPELTHAIDVALKTSSAEIDRISTFLLKEGVPLTNTSEPKPESNANEIPLGVKFTDLEIANLVVGKVTAAIALCGQGIAQCLRNDVGIIFMQSLSSLLEYGTMYKALMKKRGWILTPPYYYPPGGRPDQS